MFTELMTKSRTFLPMLLLATASLSSAEKLIPAGTLIQCTVSENKLSSKTVAIGDPVLCQVSRSSVFTSGTVLSGRFEDYKDPGHLVGKGWMELVFDRMIFPSNVIVPVNSKVVAVPHYSVDLEGKILGKGHDTRDTIEWLIPVLWPIDLINLPRRGPRPTLKNESRITIKVMDDLVVPDMAPAVRNQYGFTERPVEQQPTQITTLVFRNGETLDVSAFKYIGNAIMMVTRTAYPDDLNYGVRVSTLDLSATIDINRRKGINFTIKGYHLGDHAPDE